MNILDYILMNFSLKELEIYRLRKISKICIEQVGKQFSVTRERIRQIESTIEEKIISMKIDIEINVKQRYE
jgi:DNA-directed RNA polymerase sigma subunit (sigma70/sigma32)